MFVLCVQLSAKADDGSEFEETALRAGDEIVWHGGRAAFIRTLRDDEHARYRRVRRTAAAKIFLRHGAEQIAELPLIVAPRSDALAAIVAQYGERIPGLAAWEWVPRTEWGSTKQRFRATSRPV